MGPEEIENRSSLVKKHLARIRSQKIRGRKIRSKSSKKFRGKYKNLRSSRSIRKKRKEIIGCKRKDLLLLKCLRLKRRKISKKSLRVRLFRRLVHSGMVIGQGIELSLQYQL